MMEINSSHIFKLFVALSPFIAAYLTYLLSIKGKKKDVDIAKEKDLNTVLSNLLVVWHYLSRFEVIVNVINNTEKKDSLIPTEYIPQLMLKTGMLNDNCFSELDTSIELLKKYDPILYYRLEGTGRNLETIKKKYIVPFLEQIKPPPGMINAGAGTLLTQTLIDTEESLQDLAEELNSEVVAKVRAYIDEHRKSNIEETINEINKHFYEMILPMIPEGENKPNFSEFMDFAKTDEFKKIIKFQLAMVMNDTLNDFLSIVADNPEVSMDEMEKILESKTKKKKK